MATWPDLLGIPVFSGYDLETTDPTVRTDMEGGSARVRRRYTSAPDTVSLKFIFDQAQMATFRAFWDYDLMNGAAWAYMPVKTGRVSGMEAKECRPIAGKFKAVPAGSRHWYVEFQVEVRRGVYLWYDTINAMKLPSLELDFRGTKSLNSVLTTSAQPSVSVEFSRASEGTYYGADGLLKTAQANEARFDFDPITHACKGLLIEEARTNLLTYSEQFDKAEWSKTRAVIIPNAAVAPDGTMTADKLIEDSTTTNTHKADQPATFGTGALCFSVRAKAGERSKLQLYATDLVSSICYASFDLANGVVLGSAFQGAWSSGSASIRDIGNGWYECVLAATTSQGTVKRPEIRILNDAGIETYTGDGVSGLYLWGAQLEAGSFPTSYIPTTSAAATRSADIAQMTGANFSSWYRQDEGTFVAEWLLGSDINSTNVYCASDGTTANEVRLRYSASETTSDSAVVKSSAIQAVLSTSAQQLKHTNHSNAMAYAPNDFARSPNGGACITDNAGTPPILTMLYVGSKGSGEHLNGHIAKFTYYPKRLDNASLQALSA